MFRFRGIIQSLHPSVYGYGRRFIAQDAKDNAKKTAEKITDEFLVKEKQIMDKLYMRNRNIFRALGCTVIMTGFGVYAYRDKIKRFFGHHAADVTTITLQHENVQQQAQELVTNVIHNPEIQKQLLNLVTWAISTPEIKKEASNLIYSLYGDHEFMKRTQKFVVEVISAPEIEEKVTTVLSSSVDTLVHDKSTRDTIMKAIEKVVTSNEFKKTMSDATWDVLKKTVTPSMPWSKKSE